MKKVLLSFLLFFAIGAYSQTITMPDLCDIFLGIAEEMEEGGGVSTTRVTAFCEQLKQISFSPIPNNFIKREDNNVADSIDYFLYLPEFLDSLQQGGYTRDFAAKMYKTFRQGQGKSISQKRCNFYQDVQSLKAGEIAKINIFTSNKTEIAVIAQPFARISVKFFDSTNQDVTGRDPYKNKGYLKSYHQFNKLGTYWIAIHVKNISTQDICFTIISN